MNGKPKLRRVPPPDDAVVSSDKADEPFQSIAPSPQTARAFRDAASVNPALLGSILAEHQERMAMSDDELARDLGVAATALTGLSLCGRPNEDRFADDVQAIAQRFGVNSDRLVFIIRQHQARAAFALSRGATAILAAARDREPNDTGPSEAESADAGGGEAARPDDLR